MMELKNLKIDWLNWLKHEKRLSENTVFAYKRDLSSLFIFLTNHFNENIDTKTLKKINAKTIRSWFFYRLEKNTSSRSNARALSSIKSFLSFIIKKGLILDSGVLNINSPKFIQSLPRPLSMKQVRDIISILDENKNRWVAKRNISIIFLMWGFGMRINEVLNLRLSNMLSKNQLLVEGKGKKERIIPMYEEVRSFILKMISDTPFDIEENSFIFLGEKGKKLHPTIIQKEIRRIRKTLNLPDNTTPHSFRHTFATQLLDNMVDLRSIQELLGHQSLSSTQRYTAVDSDRLKKIIDIYHPRSSSGS